MNKLRQTDIQKYFRKTAYKQMNHLLLTTEVF